MESRLKAAEAVPANRSNAEILCACAELSYQDFRAILAENPELSFDRLIRIAGAGDTCTACLLDLEHEYVAFDRTQAAPHRWASSQTKGKPGSQSLKRRVFDLLDRLSPAVSTRLLDESPVLAGPGVEQHLWIANPGLLYGDELGGAPMRVALWVRDSDGRERHAEEQTVDVGGSMHLNVSQFLPDAAPDERTGLRIGSFEMRRSYLHPGTRGATRPHIEILTPGGACAVHTQSAIPAGERWWHFHWRPNDERMLFSIVNGERSPIEVQFSYFAAAQNIKGGPPVESRVTVPPRGARIHEAVFPDDTARLWIGQPIDVRVRSSGVNKIHALCGSPSLDRLTVDQF